jgi:hypothetical protein
VSSDSDFQEETVAYYLNQGEVVRVPAILLTPRAKALLAILLFVIAWFVGIVALIGGMEREGGILATCVFAFAGILWWAAYELSYPAIDKVLGFGIGALGIWMLNLIFQLVVRFRESVANYFFWFAAIVIALLIVGMARIRPLPDPS